MANPLYNVLSGAQKASAQHSNINRDNMMQELKSDPTGIMRSCGFNLPDGMTDPQQIVQHLMQSGQLGRNLRMIRR